MKIALISCYFGTVPDNFTLTLKTIENNPEINFFLVTDNDLEHMYNIPNNMRIIKMTFENLKMSIQDKFDFKIVLDRPYKLCDYKPVYGFIFEELISEYDFWGHYDLDVFFGNILSFLPNNIFEKYDKIYELGHLTLYRNTYENNRRFMLQNWITYKEVFTSGKICAFDEIAGMQNIFEAHNIPTYVSRDYADITYGHVRFTLSNFRVPIEMRKNNNYSKQVFYWENGRVYRAYWLNNQIFNEEFNYIHFSRRAMIQNEPIDDAFFITPKGTFSKNNEISYADFKKYNSSSIVKEFVRSVRVKQASLKRKSLYYIEILKEKF